jgi:hypothetical protein
MEIHSHYPNGALSGPKSSISAPMAEQHRDRKGQGACYSQHTSWAPAGAEPEDGSGGKRVGAGTVVFDMAQRTERKWIRGHVPLSKRPRITVLVKSLTKCHVTTRGSFVNGGCHITF